MNPRRISLSPTKPAPLEWPRDAPIIYPTPVHQAWSLINGEDWRKPARNDVTAYVCCCFSELAYLHLAQREIDAPGRYKFVPSLAHQALAAAGLSFDLSTTRRDLDFPSFVLETDAFMYVGFAVRRLALVAVRGTASLADWAINLNAGPIADDLSPGRLHRGFRAEAVKAAPLLVRHIQQFGDIDAVRFTGHSLGGAVAMVLHRRWRHWPSLTPYAYGAPRIGAEDPSPGQAYCYKRPYDLVPHAPPRWLGYRDADPWPDIVAVEPVTDLPSGTRVALDWLPRPGGKPFAIQHAVERYRRLLGLRIGADFPELAYWSFAQEQMRSPKVSETIAP